MVSQQTFAFALELSSQGAPVALITDLATQVSRHVGCDSLPTAELTAALSKAMAGDVFGGARRCDVQFKANKHSLEILVSSGGGRIWQMACVIP